MFSFCRAASALNISHSACSNRVATRISILIDVSSQPLKVFNTHMLLRVPVQLNYVEKYIYQAPSKNSVAQSMMEKGQRIPGRLCLATPNQIHELLFFWQWLWDLGNSLGISTSQLNKDCVICIWSSSNHLLYHWLSQQKYSNASLDASFTHSCLYSVAPLV